MTDNLGGMFLDALCGKAMERVSFESLLPMARIEPDPGDYFGDDGLLYCGKCHTRKETRIDIMGRERVVSCLCVCRIAEKGEQERTRRLRANADKVAELRRRGLYDAGYAEMTFDRDDRRDNGVSKIAKNYVERFALFHADRIGLMLYGEIGCGKTFLAACIANALIDKGKYVLMSSVYTLAAELGRNFGERRSDVLGEVADCDLLVLDDFGVERSTDYALEQAYEIINERYKAKKPLVVTTNLSPAQMQQEPSQSKRRIYDRVMEMCQTVRVQGDGRRADIANEKKRRARQLLGLDVDSSNAARLRDVRDGLEDES